MHALVGRVFVVVVARFSMACESERLGRPKHNRHQVRPWYTIQTPKWAGGLSVCHHESRGAGQRKLNSTAIALKSTRTHHGRELVCVLEEARVSVAVGMPYWHPSLAAAYESLPRFPGHYLVHATASSTMRGLLLCRMVP